MTFTLTLYNHKESVMKWFKKNSSTIILIVIFLIGLSLLLYPSVSDFWNSQHQSKAIAGYTKEVEKMNEEEYEQMWTETQAYNKTLKSNSVRWFLKGEEKKQYEHLLNVSSLGIMCYIEIPKIHLFLPVYHGIEEETLQTSIGHIAGSSLPVGGESTHCVLSGHRGLPSAKLFTNLDRLEKGDYFILHTLDQSLYYEVDQSLVVEPDDVSALEIEEGKDLSTLVTCTPYGVNSHRLLVRGHRISKRSAEESNVIADAKKIDLFKISVVVFGLILVIRIGIKKIQRERKRRRM